MTEHIKIPIDEETDGRTEIKLDDYLVFDLETSVNQTDKNFFKADPLYEGNKIVLGVLMTNGNLGTLVATYNPPSAELSILRATKVLVAHNIKFDLFYFFFRGGELGFKLWYKNGGRVWDTMLAEYMIQNQSVKFPSLDFCAAKYGGTLKDDKIKEYWNNGVRTEDIPQSELIEYGKQDVINTDLVYRSQMEYLSDKPLLLANIIAQMDAVTATLMMEWNGMHFDKEKAEKFLEEEEKKMWKLNNEICRSFRVVHPNMPKLYTPNLSSPTQLAALIYGNKAIKYKIKEEIKDENGLPVLWKSGAKKGQQRYTNTEMSWKPNPPSWLSDWKKSKYMTFSTSTTGEDVLKSMRDFGIERRHVGLTPPWLSIFKDLIEYRGAYKEAKTYLTGYSNVCRAWGTIHPSINHCATVTGRLSSTSPNLQNVTKKEK